MKKIILTVIIIVLTFIGCHEFTNPVDPYLDLVVHFPLDGDAKNMTDMFMNGKISEGVEASEDREGNLTGAMKFDGVDDYIKVTDSKKLRIQDELTLSAWVKIDKIDWDYARIVVKELGAYDPYVSYGLMADHNGSGKFGFHLSDVFDRITYIQADDFHAVGVWYHVAGVLENDVMSLYVNGVKQQETGDFSRDINYPDTVGDSKASLNIGGDTARNIEYLNGSVDDVRVYSKALSEAEIEAVYNGEDPVSDPVNAPSIEEKAKQYRIGGEGHNIFYDMVSTSDGETLATGYTDSFGPGAEDGWFCKFDSEGELEWQKCIGGSESEGLYDMAEVENGNFYVCGWTDSFGSGNRDFWVLKIGLSGDILWQRVYGTGSADIAYSIAPTSDGGCIVTGSDFIVTKLNALGNIVWQKRYESEYSGVHTGKSVCRSSDGYIVAGRAPSDNGDVWVIKLSESGDVEWNRSYGGAEYEDPSSLKILSDGTMIMAVCTDSYGAGGYDFWLLKLTSSGEIVWQRSIGTIETDYISDIEVAPDGGVLATGRASNNFLWCVKVNSAGELVWQQCFDEEDYYSIGCAITAMPDGRSRIGGYGMTQPGGYYHALKLELDSEGQGGNLFSPTGATVSDTYSNAQEYSVTSYTESLTVTETSAYLTDTEAVVTEIGE